MAESSVVTKQLGQHSTWRKRFRRKAKKAMKRLGKVIVYPFMCMGSCRKHGEDDSTDPALPKPFQPSVPPTFVSVGVQTNTPFIVDLLRHGGETMKHRPFVGNNTRTMSGSISIASQTQSGISVTTSCHTINAKDSKKEEEDEVTPGSEQSEPERASRPIKRQGPSFIRRSVSHQIVRNYSSQFRRSESVPPTFSKTQPVSPEQLKAAFKATSATRRPDAANANTLSSLPSQKLAITSILSSAIPSVAKPGVSSIQADFGVVSVTTTAPDSPPSQSSSNQSATSDSNTIAVAQEQMTLPVAVEAVTKSADIKTGHKLTLMGEISSNCCVDSVTTTTPDCPPSADKSTLSDGNIIAVAQEQMTLPVAVKAATKSVDMKSGHKQTLSEKISIITRGRPLCIRRSASHGIMRNYSHQFPIVLRRSESVPPSFPRKQSDLKVAFKETFSDSISTSTCCPDTSNANTLSSLPSQKLAITSILSSAIPSVAKPGVSSKVEFGADSVTTATPDSPQSSAHQSASNDSNTVAVAQEQRALPVAVEAETKSADMIASYKLTLREKISIITRGRSPCIRHSAIVRNQFFTVPKRSESLPPSFPRKQSDVKVAFKETSSNNISTATCRPNNASNANTLSSLPSQKLVITSILSSVIPSVAKPGVSSIQVDFGADSVTAATPDSPPTQSSANQSASSDSTIIAVAQEQMASPQSSAKQSASSDSNTIAVAPKQMALPEAVEAAAKSADMNAGHKLTLRGKISSLFRIITKGRKSGDLNPEPIIERATQLDLDKVEVAYLNGGIKGIYNLGNTCFMNSIIQCLSHTLELTDIFLLGDFPEGTVCSEYKKTMEKVWLPDRSRGWGIFKRAVPYSITISPSPKDYRKKSKKNVSVKRLKKAISRYHEQYHGYEEHDAPEFFSNLIGSIHEELTPVTSREVEELYPVEVSDFELGMNQWERYLAKEGSPIADIFVGQLKSTIRCLVCGHTSPRFEPFWDISLPIFSADGKSAHLADCFSCFCRDEFLVGDNQTICMSCAKRQPSGKKITIQRFPPVLVLSLKRFVDAKNKLENKVTIPLHMELAQYASPEILESTSYAAIGYDLFAVSNHTGSMNSGHYTADVKHFASEEWFHCNDKKIKAFKKSRPPEFSCEEAYVLFYRRSNSQEMPSKEDPGSSSSSRKRPETFLLN